MVLTLLCARRSSYDPNRVPDLKNPPSILDRIYKDAVAVTHHFHPDQITRMDPVLQYHLRVGPAADGSKRPA